MQSTVDSWLKTLQIPASPDEYEFKQLLRTIGIDVPVGKKIKPDDTLDLSGMHEPFVVKVCSSNILHKTEFQGIYLNILANEVVTAVQTLHSRFPGAAVLIEEYIAHNEMEFIIGALADPVFGPSIMAGAGGILTELYKDVAFRLIPCTRKDVEHMLDELVVAPVLHGYRAMYLNRDALISIIMTLSELVLSLRSLFKHMDINPVVYNGEKWYILDAKLLLTDNTV